MYFFYCFITLSRKNSVNLTNKSKVLSLKSKVFFNPFFDLILWTNSFSQKNKSKVLSLKSKVLFNPFLTFNFILLTNDFYHKLVLPLLK
jgi:hypothetical protein